MPSVIVPNIQAPIAGPGGNTSTVWYAFFQSLRFAAAGNTALQAAIDEILLRLAAVEDGPPIDLRILGVGSVLAQGSVAGGMVQLTLAGDENEPGNTFVYGTNADGEKGWHLLGDSFDTATLAKVIDPVTGVVSFDLADLPDTGAGTFKLLDRDQYGRLEGTADGDTDDVPEGAANLYFTNARADARITLQKGQPLGLATLDANSKLDAGQLPALAITDTFIVASQAAMLALVCEQGDVAVRTDLSKSFILTADPASTLANWQDLLTPTSPVTSVFGRVGSVTAASGDYTVAQVTGAAPLASPVFTGNPTAPTAATADNDTSIATTAFVKAQGYVAKTGDTMTGDLKIERAGTTVSDNPSLIVSNTQNSGSAVAREAHYDMVSDALLARIFWRRAAPVTLGYYIDLDDGAGPATRLRFTTAGWNVENSILSVSGNRVLDTRDMSSGTYTPAATAITNVTSAAGAASMWTRVGNFVRVSGSLNIDVAAAGATEVAISLPVASNLTASTDLSGNAANSSNDSARIIGDTSGDRALLQGSAPSNTGTANWRFDFTYEVK